MALDYELIVFSDDWHGLPFSCKHLLRHLLPEVRISWVQTIGLRSPQLNQYDIKRSINKIGSWLLPRTSQATEVPENLTIFDPLQIPYNKCRLIRKFNRFRLIDTIQKLGNDNHTNNRVLLTTWPFLGDLVGSLGEILSIYYRVDDFSQFPGVCTDFMQKLEEDLIRKVDIILGASRELAKIRYRDKIVKYMPHGVDTDHFTPVETKNSRLVGTNGITRPIIGFFGLLSSWIDFDLIAQISDNHPEWSLVLIGPSQLPVNSLPQAENIHFWGQVPYGELPLYAQQFDVGLIPFKINDLTIPVNPLKLLEYFSLGLPVVSTAIPEVKQYGETVYIASNVRDFCGAIQRALEEDSHSKQKERREIAAKRSWKSKAFELRNLIENALAKKNGQGFANA